MFYILDELGYIEEVSTHYIERDNKTCTEYTGAIPEGYETLDDWVLNANIRAYKLDADGNLIFDADRDAALQEEYNKNPKVLLFDNEDGSSGTINLSENLANFKYVEIYYSYLGNSWGYDYTKIYKPDGKLTNLTVTVLNNGYIYITTSTWSLSGKIMEQTKGERWRIGTSPNVTRTQNATDITIHRVVGYREGE